MRQFVLMTNVLVEKTLNRRNIKVAARFHQRQLFGSPEAGVGEIWLTTHCCIWLISAHWHKVENGVWYVL
jgi:hypothetical protein